jgi:hypothetical protein
MHNSLKLMRGGDTIKWSAEEFDMSKRPIFSFTKNYCPNGKNLSNARYWHSL